MTRSSLRIALLATVSLCAARAHAQPFTSDIDLVKDKGLVHYSQTDFRWGGLPVGPSQTRLMQDCGCMLAAMATVIHARPQLVLPWYPVALLGGTAAYEFNPRYLDEFFNRGPDATDAITGWGYKPVDDPQFCGTSPLMQALYVVGSDPTRFGSPLGFRAVIRKGNGANVKSVLDRNLRGGYPTMIVMETGAANGATASHHVFVVAGWDNDVNAYRVLDPMQPRGAFGAAYRPQVPVALPLGATSGESTYENWWSRVGGIIDLQFAVSPGAGYIFGDDPSPIEIVMTEPNGQRTGYDPATSQRFESEDSGASYWTFGPFTPPLDDGDAAGTAPKFIAYPGAPSGRYHFKVTGTADGPLHLTAETMVGTTRTQLAEFTGSIAMGEVRKYEIDFVRNGASSARQVTNFSPHAEAGEDRNGRTDSAIAFDGRRSFDADGTLAQYAWDFGDGGGTSGAQVQHAYTAPGTYTVRLTVTDLNGATSSDTLQAAVILSQRAPVAHVSGPYVGFVSTPTLPFNVFLDARSSSDPNGEALTYHWSFGDGSPDQVTTNAFTSHNYTALGDYALTLVVNDGLDDSAPATTTATIYPAPSSPPFGNLDSELVPNCGRPGDTTKLVIGEFARFDSWNLGAQGPLPGLPSNIPIGVTAAPGMIELSLDTTAFTIPFEARWLSPGRYVVEAPFVVPNVSGGRHTVFWGEGYTASFQVPCPRPANLPPIADAGGPYAGVVGAPILFDGTASIDPEDEYLSYEWHFGDGVVDEGPDPEHTYAAEGTYLVTLVVSDGIQTSAAGRRSFATTVVTEGGGGDDGDGDPSDATPPVTTAMQDPAPSAGGWNRMPVTVELTAVDNPGGSGVRDIAFALAGAETSGATVPGDSVAIGIAAEGMTTVEFFATDNAGNREAPQQHVVRIDRSSPSISGMPAPGCTLWPPNHKLVTIASISAADLGAGLVPGSLRISATSSEPANAEGDGNTSADIVIDGGRVSVRPERSGGGAGRTYTVTAEAEDLAGNTTRVQATCVVPHDQRR